MAGTSLDQQSLRLSRDSIHLMGMANGRPGHWCQYHRRMVVPPSGLNVMLMTQMSELFGQIKGGVGKNLPPETTGLVVIRAPRKILSSCQFVGGRGLEQNETGCGRYQGNGKQFGAWVENRRNTPEGTSPTTSGTYFIATSVARIVSRTRPFIYLPIDLMRATLVRLPCNCRPRLRLVLSQFPN
jgi:hypothetical protein